jgi:hypothetical protein
MLVGEVNRVDRGRFGFSFGFGAEKGKKHSLHGTGSTDCWGGQELTLGELIAPPIAQGMRSGKSKLAAGSRGGGGGCLLWLGRVEKSGSEFFCSIIVLLSIKSDYLLATC